MSELSVGTNCRNLSKVVFGADFVVVITSFNKSMVSSLKMQNHAFYCHRVLTCDIFTIAPQEPTILAYYTVFETSLYQFVGNPKAIK